MSPLKNRYWLTAIIEKSQSKNWAGLSPTISNLWEQFLKAELSAMGIGVMSRSNT